MRKSQDYMVRGGFSTTANAGGALRCDVAADMHEYALLHKRVRVRVTVDGGQTRHSTFSRQDHNRDPDALFRLLAAQLPFESWDLLWATAEATDASAANDDGAFEWPLDEYGEPGLMYNFSVDLSSVGWEGLEEHARSVLRDLFEHGLLGLHAPENTPETVDRVPACQWLLQLESKGQKSQLPDL